MESTDPAHTFLDDSQPVRDSRSFFYVYPVNSRSEIHVFDSRGGFVRSIGRTGRGPGEFEQVYRIAIGPADSIFVEGVDRRVQVFDSAGHYVRGFGLPFLAHGIVHLGNDRLLLQGMFATAGSVGFPLHIIDGRGTLLRSFGSTSPSLTIDDFTSTLRGISLAEDGTIVSTLPNRYRIERWGKDGRNLGQVERKVDWFLPWEGRTPGDVDLVRPLPYQGPAMVANDVIWTGIRVPDMNWRQTRTQQRTEYDRPLNAAARDEYVDQIIEAIDRRSGELLASHRIRSGLVGFLGDGFVFHRTHDTDGLVAITISRITLVRH